VIIPKFEDCCVWVTARVRACFSSMGADQSTAQNYGCLGLCGRTDVYDLAATGSTSAVAAYLDFHSDFDIDSLDEDLGDTLLHTCCQYGKLETAEMLLRRGASLDVRSEQGAHDLPLHVASQFGYTRIVERLLREDKVRGGQVGPDPANSLGFTPLSQACAGGHLGAARLLREHGADINARGSAGWTPAHFAAAEGQVRVLAYLVEEGADLRTARASDGSLPLHLLATEGHLSAASYLFDAKPDLDWNSSGPFGMSALHLAAANGHADLVNFLVFKQCDINKRSGDSLQPLHYACGNGHVDVVAHLLEAGARANERGGGGDPTPPGVSPLHLAALGGHRELVELLISCKAEINAVDSHGMTPLAMAAKRGQANVVKVLIESGADVSIKSHLKQSPKDIAQSGGFLSVAQMLDDGNSNGYTSTDSGKFGSSNPKTIDTSRPTSVFPRLQVQYSSRHVPTEDNTI